VTPDLATEAARIRAAVEFFRGGLHHHFPLSACKSKAAKASRATVKAALELAERRQAEFIRNHPEATGVELARALGVSPALVSMLRKKP
jgi:DNA-binding MarR family transcriptional regulator